MKNDLARDADADGSGVGMALGNAGWTKRIEVDRESRVGVWRPISAKADDDKRQTRPNAIDIGWWW